MGFKDLPGSKIPKQGQSAADKSTSGQNLAAGNPLPKQQSLTNSKSS